jgi:hypothetical protein
VRGVRISLLTRALTVLMLLDCGCARSVYGENYIHYSSGERYDMWVMGDQGEEPATWLTLLNGSGWQSGVGEAMTVTSLPPRGDEVWRMHEDQREEVREEEERAYRERLEEQHELEWEYLHLPMRSYPGFFDSFQLQTLFPQLERMFSHIHYVFWIISGGMLTIGLIWQLSNSSSGKDAAYAVALVLCLILLMGVAAKMMRWADYFVYDVVDALGGVVSIGEQEESHYSHLVKVFYGIQVSLDRARERIWREQDTPRSRIGSFFDPISKAMGEMVDWAIKGGYYIVCLSLSVVVLLVLLILAVLEQGRLLLLYVGYSITPLLISGLTVPLLRGGARVSIQNIIAVLCWPIGWVVCFLVGNVLAQRLVFAFQDDPATGDMEWYHPSTLAVHIWRAFYEDKHGMFFGVALGVCILSVGLLFGIWWVSRNLHLAIAGYSGVVLKSVSTNRSMHAFTASTAGAYRSMARWLRNRSTRKNTESSSVTVGGGQALGDRGTPLGVKPTPTSQREAQPTLTVSQQRPITSSSVKGTRRFQTRVRRRR